jgi:hypothetical protein
MPIPNRYRFVSPSTEMSLSTTRVRKICRHVLGIKSSACAIALTPIGSLALPSKRNIAIARDTAGTARVRTASFTCFVAAAGFVFGLIMAVIIRNLLY